MINMMDDGDLLRAIRAKLKLSQEQLANQLGVSFGRINSWESGLSSPHIAARGAIEALAREAGLETDG